VTIDGVSLRPLLQGDDDSDPHDCLYYWREKDLYAIRCGPYKAHFQTRSGFNSSDPGTLHDPPLMFQVEWDPAESSPLDPSDYPQQVAALTAAAQAHVREVERERPPSLYVPQNFTLMPCCPRGGMDTRPAELAALSGDWSNALWEDCVCQRPGL